MVDTGLARSPQIKKGALVQLVPEIIGIVPNIVVFQYNPQKITHSLTPWNPFAVDQTQRGAQAPTVQPFDPKETYSLTLDLDATDELADGDPVAQTFGVKDRLAALAKLTQPSQGLFGDLLASAQALLGNANQQAVRPTVPVVLLVLGPGIILPVRITSFSVEQTLFSPTLYPVQATVQLGLEVLTPDVFKCQRDITTDIAVAAYNFTKLQENALAVANIANTVDEIRAVLPF